jgi:hypothetical protein
MTSDRWNDRLSEYLDGELAPEEARELEVHLEACAGCRETLADLRRVTGAARALRDREPPAHLWAGIAQRIAEEPPEVRVVSLFDAKRARRRVSLSIPQLLAAGLVLALASAGSVWMTMRGGAAASGGTFAAAPVEVTREAPAGRGPEAESVGAEDPATLAYPEEGTRAEAGSTEAPPAGQAPRATGGDRPAGARGEPGAPESRSPSGALPRSDASARLVAYPADPAYDAAVADLQGVLEEGRDRLDPRTVQVLEESLAAIDAAIDDARRALAADPANARLNTYLAGTMQRKLQLLREASQIVTATT